MTQEEQYRIVVSYDTIFKNIINKNLPRHKFKEDILQDFYLRIFKCNSLPKEAIEILKFCKTVLKNLMLDALKYKKYKLISEMNETIGIERNEDDIEVYSFQSNSDGLNSYKDYEQFFKDSLDDCLIDAYEALSEFDKLILIEHLLLGYTAKEVGERNNTYRQTVKNVVYKFRKDCGIN